MNTFNKIIFITYLFYYYYIHTYIHIYKLLWVHFVGLYDCYVLQTQMKIFVINWQFN